MMRMGLAVLLAFGLAASVTACGDVNTGEDKKEAAQLISKAKEQLKQ